MIYYKQVLDPNSGEWYIFSDDGGATRAIRFKTNLRTGWISTGLATGDVNNDYVASITKSSALRIDIRSADTITSYESTDDGVSWGAV